MYQGIKYQCKRKCEHWYFIYTQQNKCKTCLNKIKNNKNIRDAGKNNRMGD